MLFLRGIIALIQTTILPGLLIMKVLRIPRKGVLQSILYCFGLSLLANYVLVLFLTLIKIYRIESLGVILFIEFAAFIWLYRKELSTPISSYVEAVSLSITKTLTAIRAKTEDLWKHDQAYLIGAAIVSAAAILFSIDSFVWLSKVFKYNLGSIFQLWDAVLNWNPWAVIWAHNSIPSAYHYGQLIPANWSIAYLLMGNFQIQFFATAIMPLFVIFTLLMLLDLGLDYWSLGCFIALVITRYMVKKFTGEYITDGYVDLAVMFFNFLAIYTLLKAKQLKTAGDMETYILVGGIFAAGAAVTKQAGLYILFIYPLLAYLLLAGSEKDLSKRRKLTTRIATSFLYALLIAAPWYIISQIMIARGINSSELPGVSQAMGVDKSLIQKLLDGIIKLQKYNALFVISILSLPILGKAYRWLVLLVVIPYSLMWGFLYSYDVRNLSVVFPIVSLTAGMGLEAVIRHSEKLSIWLHASRVKASVILALLLIATVAISLRVSNESLISRQIELQRQLWFPQLNEVIYTELAKQGPEVKIISNYRIDTLPGIERTIILYDFPDLDSFLKLLDEYPDAKLILYPGNANKAIIDYIMEGLDQGSFHLITDMGTWTLVER